MAADRPVFVEQGGVTLASASVSDVIKLPGAGGYRMYFTSAGYFVKSATSADGLNWSVEAGMRLSTSAASLDASSITAAGIYYNTAASHAYTLYYVGIGATGRFSLLRAHSGDGVSFTKDSSFYKQLNSGYAYLGSPKAWPVSSTQMYLYCVYDAGGFNSSGTYRAGYFTSTDKGSTFNAAPAALLSGTTVYALAVSSLTGGSVRLHAVVPPPGCTGGYQIKSWLSSDNGRTFAGAAESGVRYATSAAVNISQLAVMRDADYWRWRLFATFGPLASTGAVQTLLTFYPTIESVSPGLVYQSDPNVTLTVGGEIFSSSGALTATLYGASGSISITSVTRNSDTSLSLDATTNGATIGVYTLKITDADGWYGTYASALTVDYKPGNLDMMDNVFRPLNGESCRGDATVFAYGRMTVRVYTTNGKKVRTLYDSIVAPGTYTITWDGKTESGNYAASGMYLAYFKGPKLDTVAKVVVIK